jgi:hypothetical protein
MPTVPVTYDEAQEAVNLLKIHKYQNIACKHATNRQNRQGISRQAFQNRLKRAEQLGLTGRTKEAPHGFEVRSVRETIDKNGDVKSTSVKYVVEAGEEYVERSDHSVKGESVLVDSQGRVLHRWVKTKQSGEIDPLELCDRIKEKFSDYSGLAKPIKAPENVKANLMTFFPLADWHLGLYVWGAETEGASWTLQKAVSQLFQTYRHLMSISEPSNNCVILGGGDLLHFDNYEPTTRRSKNVLDASGRWPEVLLASSNLIARIVELAAQRHNKVLVRLLPGNHDEHSAIAISYFLAAHFRNDPRIDVDCDPSLYWWHKFGKVLLGATHGHTVKIDKMPSIMAHRRPKDWGSTMYRYVHGFHLHHSAKTATEGQGVITEIHQSPTPKDAWAFNAGFLSNRSMKSITYHKDYGEISRSQMTMGIAEEDYRFT